MNEVIKNLLTRRSVRAFTSERIPREDLELILKTAIYAPSGHNMQTWRFTAVTDRKKIQELAALIGRKIGREDYDFYDPAAIILPSNEKTSRWGVEDDACALENIFLAAHSLGIGSVWINQLRDLCDDPEIRALLSSWDIPEDHVVYGLAALGYAAAEPPQNVEKKGVVKIID